MLRVYGRCTSDISQGFQDLQRVVEFNDAFRYYGLQQSSVQILQVMAFFSRRSRSVCACPIHLRMSCNSCHRQQHFDGPTRSATPKSNQRLPQLVRGLG